MRSARGRRRVWRAARRAAEQARDGEGVGEAQDPAEEVEGKKWGRKERLVRQCSENTLQIVLHLPTMSTATATATAAAAVQQPQQRACSNMVVRYCGRVIFHIAHTLQLLAFSLLAIMRVHPQKVLRSEGSPFQAW